MEDDDLGFGLPATQKKAAKSGRRAAPVPTTPAPALDEEELAVSAPVKKNSDGPPGRPNKAVSGWGEDVPARKPRTRQLGEGFETLEDDLVFGSAKPQGQQNKPRPRQQMTFFDEDVDEEDRMFRSIVVHDSDTTNVLLGERHAVSNDVACCLSLELLRRERQTRLPSYAVQLKVSRSVHSRYFVVWFTREPMCSPSNMGVAPTHILTAVMLTCRKEGRQSPHESN
ncbi:hypothetical protein PoB_007480000 [Plakobranchus ocellatus]|uniref:Uncharacterized protein n=1 Tax=Plakobranchus ocellatus TaxID=259542 RepID=A0AAV4DVW1_9GAST|nr:hypothetical protein PoB_007480000 [Plakobranchus ocellatus]